LEQLLSEKRVRRLDGIGFEWDLKDRRTWEEGFSTLLEFKAAHGHCDVPVSAECTKLLVWVRTQRVRRKRGLLSEDRIRRLDELGFVWELLDVRWERLFGALGEYAKAHGDCNGPARWKENPPLALWVASQRNSKYEGTLSPEKVSRLEAIGFRWRLDIEGKWTRRYSDLLKFKNRFGHCPVPVDYPDNPELATWAVVQRRNRRQGKLSEERIRQLDDVGFDWGPGKNSAIRRTWEDSVQALRAFKTTHGHCNVHHDYQDAPALYGWIGIQRRKKAQGKLSEEQIRELDEIGLPWDRE